MPNANWSNPTLTSTYVNFVSEVKNRDEDLALQFDGTTSTNIPTNAIRWDSSAGRWKKWNGSAWAELAATYALTGLTTTGSATFNGLVQGIGANTAGLASLLQLKTGAGNTYGLQILGNYTTEDYLIQNYYNGYLALGTNNIERLRITSSGLVGIGTTTPSYKLEVFGASNANEIRSSDGTIISQWYQDTNGYGVFGTVSNHALVFRTNATERLRITSSGLVGIATTTPRGNLSIANNTTGATVNTSLHLGYSSADFYGFRLVNTNNPSNTAAGTFTLQRGTVAAWADVLSVDNGGLITANSGLAGTFGLSTAASTSSVSSVTYSPIPNWVKCIKLMLSGVSMTNTDNLLIRLSFGGTFQIAGYASSSLLIGAPSDGSVGALTGAKHSPTNGFGIYSNNASNALTGIVTLQNITGNTWIINGSLQSDTALNNVITVNGSVTLSGTCDGIRLLSSGTGTFDAGTINIAYEG